MNAFHQRIQKIEKNTRLKTPLKPAPLSAILKPISADHKDQNKGKRSRISAASFINY